MFLFVFLRFFRKHLLSEEEEYMNITCFCLFETININQQKNRKTLKVMRTVMCTECKPGWLHWLNYSLNLTEKNTRNLQSAYLHKQLPHNTMQYTVPKKLVLPCLYLSFVRAIKFMTNRKFSSLCLVLTRSDFHLTIITLTHWININHVLW